MTDRRITLLFAGITSLTLLTLVFIIGYVMINGLPGLTLEFLIESPREMGRAGGVLPAIVGTVLPVSYTHLDVYKRQVQLPDTRFLYRSPVPFLPVSASAVLSERLPYKVGRWSVLFQWAGVGRDRHIPPNAHQ